MKLLLDTHIWIWSALEPARLSRRVAGALTGPDNQVWIELSSPMPMNGLPQALPKPHFGKPRYPLTHEVVMTMEQIELSSRDPADCFLAATARSFDLTLVTSDANLIRGRGYQILANS